MSQINLYKFKWFFYQTELLIKFLEIHTLLVYKSIPSATNTRNDGESKALSLKNLMGVIICLIKLYFYLLKIK
jgi:hypothetical protein